MIRISLFTALALSVIGCSAIREPDDGPTRLEEWETSLPEYLDIASDYQDRIIGDAVVTQEEHEAALAEFVRCVEERTGEAISVERKSNGEVAGIVTRGVSAQFDRCREEFFSYVELGYDAMLNAEVTRGGLVRAIVACLRAHGVNNLPADADDMELADLSRHVALSDDEAGSASAQYNECWELHG